MRTLHLFAGAGGGLLSDLILGHEPVCAVEWNPYCCAVLRERAAEGWFPNLQVFEGDVRLFPASEWKGRVDCIHAGFPCPPFSLAGKRKGALDDRNMWPATTRIIGEIRPEWVFLENVAGFVSSGYGWTVLSDLSSLGYDARWTVLGADQVGAPHRRERWWCLANSQGKQNRGKIKREIPPNIGTDGQDVAHAGLPEPSRRNQDKEEHQYRGGGATWGKFAPRSYVADATVNDEPWCCGTRERRERRERPENDGRGKASLPLGCMVDGLAVNTLRRGWWDEEPDISRVTKKEENRVSKLKALGNGQVPICAALAFKMLMDNFK